MEFHFVDSMLKWETAFGLKKHAYFSIRPYTPFHPIDKIVIHNNEVTSDM